MISRRALIGAPAVLALAACGPQPVSTVSESGDGVGGPFQLVDTEGRPVTETILAGKWSVIYFGYTRCPGPCPTALMALKAGLDLTRQARDIRTQDRAYTFVGADGRATTTPTDPGELPS